jgi:hypothetical protein
MQSSHIEIELSPLPAVRFLFGPSTAQTPQIEPVTPAVPAEVVTT